MRNYVRVAGSSVACALLLAASPAAAATFVEEDGIVSMETEHYDNNTGGWEKRTDDAAATGGEYMIALVHKDQSKRIEFTVDFQSTGRFRVWLRAKCTGTEDNDCYVMLDGNFGQNPSDSGWVDVSGVKTDKRSFDWQGTTKSEQELSLAERNRGTWVAVSSAGVHTFQLGSRSVDFKADKICLVHESLGSYTPTGVGPAETTSGGTTNRAPVASNANVTTAEDTPVSITLSYSDSDGPTPYTFTITQNPAHGTLTGSPNTRTYTPNSGYAGPDSFKWRVTDGDGAQSNEATVSITVTGSGSSVIVIECEDMTLTDYIAEADGYIAVNHNAGKTTGTATASFPGAAGRYRIEVLIAREDDGQPTLEVYVAGALVSTINYDLGAAKRDPQTVDLGEFDIAAGAEIKLVGTLDAGAAARVDKIIFTRVGSPGNSAPTVNLSASPVSGSAPLIVTFEAGSSDPDGDTLTHEWDFDYDGSSFTVDDNTGATAAASHTYTEGTYTAAVRVDDGNGHAVIDTVPITVTFEDSDGDGLPDDWEQLHFGDLSQGPNDDFDLDGASNYKEYLRGTDPTDDTDFPPPSSTSGGGLCSPAGTSGQGATFSVVVILGLVAWARRRSSTACRASI